MAEPSYLVHIIRDKSGNEGHLNSFANLDYLAANNQPVVFAINEADTQFTKVYPHFEYIHGWHYVIWQEK